MHRPKFWPAQGYWVPTGVAHPFRWRVQSEVEGGEEYEEVSHEDQVPHQWLPPYDGTRLRAGSVRSASSVSTTVSEGSGASGGARGLGTVLMGRSRLVGNYRRATASAPYWGLCERTKTLSVANALPLCTARELTLKCN